MTPTPAPTLVQTAAPQTSHPVVTTQPTDAPTPEPDPGSHRRSDGHPGAHPRAHPGRDRHARAHARPTATPDAVAQRDRGAHPHAISHPGPDGEAAADASAVGQPVADPHPGALRGAESPHCRSCGAGSARLVVPGLAQGVGNGTDSRIGCTTKGAEGPIRTREPIAPVHAPVNESPLGGTHLTIWKKAISVGHECRAARFASRHGRRAGRARVDDRRRASGTVAAAAARRPRRLRSCSPRSDDRHAADRRRQLHRLHLRQRRCSCATPSRRNAGVRDRPLHGHRDPVGPGLARTCDRSVVGDNYFTVDDRRTADNAQRRDRSRSAASRSRPTRRAATGADQGLRLQRQRHLRRGVRDRHRHGHRQARRRASASARPRSSSPSTSAPAPSTAPAARPSRGRSRSRTEPRDHHRRPRSAALAGSAGVTAVSPATTVNHLANDVVTQTVANCSC